MAVKNANSKGWTITPSVGGRRWSGWPAGDKPPTYGFTQRPYFFQPDASRLADSITNSEPQATGASTNNWGQPLGFITAMTAKLATPASWSDIPDWNMAVAGWLTNNASMRAVAKAACLAKVRANPTGSPISGDEYQHIEDQMLATALVVDCCYADFTASERAEVATYINGAMTYAEGQVLSFWPLTNEPHNNYWQNHLLARALIGICGEGWLSQAASWRTKFETWAQIAANAYKSPTYVGPQVTEGRYYSSYTMNLLWALRQYDAVVGTNYTSQLSFTPSDQLNLALYQLGVGNGASFHIGSEAQDNAARLNTTPSALWHMLMHLAGASDTNSQVAKTIYVGSEMVAHQSGNAYSRSGKAFWNFMWPAMQISNGALTAKTDRRLALPSPGGAQTYLRSSAGWSMSGEAAACVIFASPSGSAAAYSHANPDAPGFQWSYRGGTGQAASFLVVDPEYRGSSGIAAEAGTQGAFTTNAVVPGSLSTVPAEATYPVKLFDEDNTGASVPHYYVSINAQPYWNTTTTYRRSYVWLDDLRVVVIHDRIVGGGNKNWQLHIDGTASVAGSVATGTTTNGSYSPRVIDLFSTSGAAMTAANIAGSNSITGTVYRISQVDTAADYRSLKVLDVGGRVTAYSLTSGTGYLQANITVGGVARTVRFFDDGSHATVA